MISKDCHIKFARFVWLAVGEEAKQSPGLQVNIYCRDIFLHLMFDKTYPASSWFLLHFPRERNHCEQPFDFLSSMRITSQEMHLCGIVLQFPKQQYNFRWAKTE